MVATVAPLLSSSAGAASTTTTTVPVTTTTVATTPTTTTTVPPYVTGNKYLSVSVDTVVGGGSATGSTTSGGCGLESTFGQGATVVFRLWGIDNATGLPLVGGLGTKPNVQSVTIEDLPGVTPNPTMNYSTSDGYYTFGWKTTTATPIGVVPFRIVVTLAPVGAVYKVELKRVVVTVKGVRRVEHKRVRMLISEKQSAKSYTYSEAGQAEPSLLTINATA
jgi:hypothetical protein